MEVCGEPIYDYYEGLKGPNARRLSLRQTSGGSNINSPEGEYKTDRTYQSSTQCWWYQWCELQCACVVHGSLNHNCSFSCFQHREGKSGADLFMVAEHTIVWLLFPLIGMAKALVDPQSRNPCPE